MVVVTFPKELIYFIEVNLSTFFRFIQKAANVLV